MMASSPLQLAARDLEQLRAGGSARSARAQETARPLPIGIAAIDEALPDAGLPRGGVVELCAPSGLACATRLALSACASAQREGGGVWCGWIDGSRTLYAPGVAQAGVALDRLLVVRPPARDLGRVAVRLAASHVFSLIVIDRCGVPGAIFSEAPKGRWSTVVRRLALAAEHDETTIVLLSTTEQAKRDSLPIASRIELGRPAPDRLGLRISKDRRHRGQSPLSIPLSIPLFAPRPMAIPLASASANPRELERAG
jgi:recombination protein RecA